ncbi:hypothetical protein, conserved [Babesia bigemina]|uniref:Uncharacterized protein n=1 Tax=Babesia bigemina TaxID=5866 RepID=A0A061BQ72_BABBI|nr:hypothetical protein, conserved [Babesia bigemina]CDR71617.1 hypothetical protein, conserved [Babesia bigemina]|eukprot:XP_012770564.1 hypothetical protein, conserved [Babesia bigemina]
MASHTQRGARIYSVLDDFCGSDDSPLTTLCAYFACLLATPPKTLGDMFAFYYNFLNDWCGTNPERTRLRELPYADAVKDANFKNDDNRLDITSMFKSASHEYVPASTHMKGDLFTLVGCNPKHVPTLPCGPYLQPLSLSIPSMFSETNADKYLSWIVYLTETFYDLLSKLLADCKSKCGLPQSRCNQYRCIKNCPAATSSTKTPSPTHSAGCKSIVQCKSALPNLYKYGFHFRSATVLNRTYKDEEKRTADQNGDQRGDQRVDQRADQSVDQRGDQSHDQRGDQSHDQRGDLCADQRGDQCDDQYADQAPDLSADQGADQRHAQSGDQRHDQSTDQRHDQSGDQRHEQGADQCHDQVDGHGSDDMVTAAMTWSRQR